MFLRKYKEKQFVYVHNIWTDGVFVTELPSNAEISVWRIVWVTTNCSFMAYMRTGVVAQLATGVLE